jgi:hypothetical protein
VGRCTDAYTKKNRSNIISLLIKKQVVEHTDRRDMDTQRLKNGLVRLLLFFKIRKVGEKIGLTSFKLSFLHGASLD